MARRLCVLLLGAGLALSQEEKDDEGISIDEKPSGPEKEPAKAAPARVPGQKVATVTIREKAYSFALPADWVLIPEDDPTMELSWEVLLPGSTQPASLILLREDGLIDARSAPYSKERALRGNKEVTRFEVRTKPCPRLLQHRPLRDTEWIDLFLWVSVRNNIYALRIACIAADLPQAEADMLVAAQSFRANVEIWPPIPKGYVTSPEGTWLVARAPNVTASLAPLVAVLKEQEKRFRRDHGTLPKSDAPIVVLVHGSQGDGAKIDPGVADGVDGFWADTRHRRIFAVPVGKDNLEHQGLLASVAQVQLFVARYGDVSPVWVCVGERGVARAEAVTRKPLPSLHEEFVSWIPKLKLHTLDELRKMISSEKPDWDLVSTEMFFYVAMLHAGKYRKQYDAFLEDYAETGDGDGAFDRHFGKIDQEELRAATNQFLLRIKEVKAER